MSVEESEKIGVLTERIDHLIGRLDRFEELAESRFVTRLEFTPVQRLVYGGVGLAMSLVIAAVMGLVLIRR
jgi:hypothetical protein